jgi:hypothetical protein
MTDRIRILKHELSRSADPSRFATRMIAPACTFIGMTYRAAERDTLYIWLSLTWLAILAVGIAYLLFSHGAF